MPITNITNNAWLIIFNISLYGFVNDEKDERCNRVDFQLHKYLNMAQTPDFRVITPRQYHVYPSKCVEYMVEKHRYLHQFVFPYQPLYKHDNN